MFDKQYHLRTTKMIVYQIAMILMVISESVGTAALSGTSKRSNLTNYTNTFPDYVDQQDGISTRNGRLVVQNNNIVGTFSFNIFVGIAVATIFGSGFFFDLFWPERVESPGVRLAWKISAVVVSIMALADQIASTVRPTISLILETILTISRSSSPNTELTSAVSQTPKPNHTSAKTVLQTQYTDTTQSV